MAQIYTDYGTTEFLIIFLIGSIPVTFYVTSWYKSYLIRHDKYDRKRELRFRGWLFVVLVVLIFIFWMSQGGSLFPPSCAVTGNC